VAIGIIFLVVAAPAGYLYWDHTSHFESTDDAFIAARQFSVAPKVAGYVTAVPVTDNQHVDRGDVIAQIDERDYRVALEQADAQVAAADDNIHNIDAQISVQEAQVVEANAKIESAQAALVFAQEQANRYQQLVQTGAGTVQNAQQYSSGLHQQEAAVQNAKASLSAAQRQVGALRAQRKSAEASLGQAEAQRDQAVLNLSYTAVTADQPGKIANLTGAVGQYATVGTALTSFVPDDISVTANFKETQLDAMRPGQSVTMEIDAYPTLQASYLAYTDVFWVLMILALLAAPLAMTLRKVKLGAAAPAAHRAREPPKSASGYGPWRARRDRNRLTPPPCLPFCPSPPDRARHR
jgi:membrane fusion protein (multidrug efflux system)